MPTQQVQPKVKAVVDYANDINNDKTCASGLVGRITGQTGLPEHEFQRCARRVNLSYQLIFIYFYYYLLL